MEKGKREPSMLSPLVERAFERVLDGESGSEIWASAPKDREIYIDFRSEFIDQWPSYANGDPKKERQLEFASRELLLPPPVDPPSIEDEKKIILDYVYSLKDRVSDLRVAEVPPPLMLKLLEKRPFRIPQHRMWRIEMIKFVKGLMDKYSKEAGPGSKGFGWPKLFCRTTTEQRDAIVWEVLEELTGGCRLNRLHISGEEELDCFRRCITDIDPPVWAPTDKARTSDELIVYVMDNLLVGNPCKETLKNMSDQRRKTFIQRTKRLTMDELLMRLTPKMCFNWSLVGDILKPRKRKYNL